MYPVWIITIIDSNQIFGLYTLPILIPIFIHEFCAYINTNCPKNNDLPIPMPSIPITGLALGGLLKRSRSSATVPK